jgi:hypothetical protein
VRGLRWMRAVLASAWLMHAPSEIRARRSEPSMSDKAPCRRRAVVIQNRGKSKMRRVSIAVRCCCPAQVRLHSYKSAERCRPRRICMIGCREARWPPEAMHHRRSELPARRRKPSATVRVVRYSEREGTIRRAGDAGEPRGQRSRGERNKSRVPISRKSACAKPGLSCLDVRVPNVILSAC